MVKRIVCILFLVIISTAVFSQQKIKIDLKQTKQKTKNTEIVKNISNGLMLSETISTFELVETETKEGLFSQLISDGMSKTFDEGKPDLPVINRLIEIPFNSDAKIKVLSFDEEIIELKDYGLTRLIIPAQASHAKSKDIKDVPFIKDQIVYSKNEFFKKDIVKFEDKGYLRDKHLGYIEVSPFAYNPVTNTLKVLNNIEIEISFIPKQNIKPQSIDRLKSPYYKNVAYNTINKVEESKALISGPVKYVIVSDPMFEETLQPFIEWKTMKGFKVIEAYTDDSAVGTTTTSIKAYLQDLYDNPADDISPTFVLLVGDVAQIPAFSGSGHVTDLYYCEYTGDKLPEVFYGRFSAETIGELQPQIDKTLEIEKYEMLDPSYLDNVVLVAGVDGTHAPTYGNGFVNYANDYYTNTENGIASYYYLYNDNSGVMASNNAGASASIRSYISSGVALANYTAHCSSDGWANPGFTRSHIDELTNEHMYPLIIGNCCESSTFNTNDCFAEKILMAENKGAVGYIGGSNSTYWDEDYYWGVGLASISANPTYDGSGLGAYDRFFHLNEEAKQDWYVTQGQINVAGNLAVEASTSSLKAYYWEIYHLMGDPSLTPYVTVPEVLTASYNSEIFIGSSSFQVTTEENAYVAVSKNGILLDAKLADATCLVELTFESLDNVGTLDLVITKQNRQPKIDEITIVPATTPYIVLDYYIIDDALGNNNSEVDFGETIKLDIQLKNVADNYDAFNVVANLISVDTNIVLIDSVETFGTILRNDSLLIETSFTIDFKNKFSDQQKVSFDLEISGEDVGSVEYTWNSKIDLTVNAPEIEIGELLIDDASGDNDGILDPGETADILLIISNNGNATISNLNGLAAILGGGETYLTLNNSETGSFSLNAQETDTIKFNVTADSGTPIGTIIYMSFEIDDVSYDYYSKSVNKELSIGEIPEFLISEEGSHIITTERALFYDSGGADAEYSNSENYTITFKPEDPNKFITANFLSFSVEPDGNACFDYLEIYDGENTSSTLIGSYCDANPPTTIVATNDLGALTFRFYSDGSVTQAGWEAEIRSFVGYDYQVTVSGQGGPIEGAIVEFNNQIDTTGVDGIAEFFNVPEGINYPLMISALGYDDFETSINLFEDTSEGFNLEVSKYDVRFNLYDEDGLVDGDITFDDRTLLTSIGQITFKDVEYSLNKEYFIQSYGHVDSTASLEVTADLSEDIVLKAIKYDIEFVVSNGTNPLVDAVVEFDKKEILTNSAGKALFGQVKMDTMLTYIIRKTGYNNFTGITDVEKDSTINITMSAGTATFNVSFQVSGETNPVYNAQVVLDEDTLCTNSDGIAVFENVLEADDIPYKISKTHFNDVTETIDVAGNNVYVDTTLTYKSYEILFSINDGENPIEGATISFDGKSGTTDSNGEYVFDVTYSLNNQYVISKTGYNDVSGMINADESKTIELSMALITYNVTFVVADASSYVVENVLIEFNSESNYTDTNGEAVFNDVLPEENMVFTLSKEGFWDYDSTLNVVDADVVFNARLSSTTGIIPIKENNIKIYPNPSNGIFNLEINNAENSTYTVKVFDIIGVVVYTKTITGTTNLKEQIDISQNAKGMYFLSIESDNGSVISRRIIIK